jgi:hypothetical protein
MPSFLAAAVTLPFDKSKKLTFKLHGPKEKSCPCSAGHFVRIDSLNWRGVTMSMP